MENEGEKSARGKSRRKKERGGESTSGKRPPVLLNEEDDGPSKMAICKGKSKAARRSEREQSPDQEEDVIDGFVIVSFKAEDGLKNALKKHSNVYENRIMQLPMSRQSAGGVAKTPEVTSRTCGNVSSCTTPDIAATTTLEPLRTCTPSKVTASHVGKGKENKAVSPGAVGVHDAATALLEQTSSNAATAPFPVPVCEQTESFKSEATSARKGIPSSRASGAADDLRVASPAVLKSTDPASSAPELSSAIASVSSYSSLSGRRSTPTAASQATCATSTVQPQVPPSGAQRPVSGSLVSKEPRADRGEAANTKSSSCSWNGDSKTHVGHPATAVTTSVAPSTGMACYLPAEASAAATVASSMPPSYYGAYGNSFAQACMLGMAAPPGHHALASPAGFMANAAVAAAAAAGLPSIAGPFGSELSAYNSQELQRELSCRFLESQMDRTALAAAAAAFPPYSAAAASSLQQQQHLYSQLLQSGSVPSHYGTSLLPPPSPHMYGGKASKLDAMALWGQTIPGTFSPALTAAAAHAAATGPSPFQSVPGGSNSILGDLTPSFLSKKSGKWCAAHVKIARLIYNCQQKNKPEQNGLCSMMNMKSEAAFMSQMAAAAASNSLMMRSSAAAASSHDSSHRGNSAGPLMQSPSLATSSASTSSSTRSPHNSNCATGLNFSPANAYSSNTAAGGMVDWTARMGGAAALLSLAPGNASWPRPEASGTERTSSKEGSLATAAERQTYGLGSGRVSSGSNEAADGFESHSHSGGVRERGNHTRSRSRSPVRTKSRETSADKIKIKTERKDDDIRSMERLMHGGADLSSPHSLSSMQQQQQAATAYSSMLDMLAGNQRWMASLYAAAGSGMPPVPDRRLWSPFDRHAALEYNRRRHAADMSSAASTNQEADHRGGDWTHEQRLMSDVQRFAAASVSASAVDKAMTDGGKLRHTLSPFFAATGGGIGALAPYHPPLMLNGHRLLAAAASVAGGGERPTTSAPGLIGGTVPSSLVGAAVVAGSQPSKKTNSPALSCAHQNGLSSADNGAASESEAHSR